MNYKNMENNQGKNMTFTYLLVVFFALFVGTGIFLVLNNNNSASKKEGTAATSTIKQEEIIVPSIKPTQGSLSLKLVGEAMVTKNSEIQINLFADSNEKNIAGYDLALSYDPSSFDFVKAESNLADFKIYTYKRDGYLSFLATKSLQSQTSAVFIQTKIASLSFKPIKAGKFNFSLKSLIGKDKTDLVTDKTEVLNPQLNNLEIEVN